MVGMDGEGAARAAPTDPPPTGVQPKSTDVANPSGGADGMAQLANNACLTLQITITLYGVK